MNNRGGVRLYRYLTVGAVATALQFILLRLAVLLGIHPLVGSAFGYLISAIFNYWGNCIWTFGYKGEHAEAIIKFIVVIIVGLLVNSVVFFLVMGHTHYLLAQMFATAAAITVNYLGNAFWTFRCEGRHA